MSIQTRRLLLFLLVLYGGYAFGVFMGAFDLHLGVSMRIWAEGPEE